MQENKQVKNQEFVETVEKWIKTLNDNPLDNYILNTLADNVTFEIPGPTSNKIFGTFKGKRDETDKTDKTTDQRDEKTVNDFFEALAKKVKKQNFEIKKNEQSEETLTMVKGNMVLVFLDETIFPRKYPKKTYLNSTAWLFTLNEKQKIVKLYCYDDTAITSEALG